MGGRTKAVSGGADAGGSQGLTAAAGAGASSMAALGSLAVDPDEVVRNIKTSAGQLPLDEALMQVSMHVGLS